MGEVNCRLKLAPVGLCVFRHAYGVANADVEFAEKIPDAHYEEETIAVVNRRESEGVYVWKDARRKKSADNIKEVSQVFMQVYLASMINAKMT